MGKRWLFLVVFSTSLIIHDEAEAVVSTNTWLPGGGLYTNAANWSPAVVPNNNNGTGDTYVARIDGGSGTASAVVLDTSGFAIDRLIVSAGDSLTITNADDLTIQVGMTVTGTVALASDGSGAYLYLMGTQTIDGTGQILLTGTYLNGFVFANNGGTVTVGSGITIHGGGTIRGDVANPMVNQGTISADVNGWPLVVQDFTNQGRLSALSGGTLQLQGNWSSSGVISNDASIVNFGGTFTTASLSTLKTVNGTNFLGGVLINTNTALTLTADFGTLLIENATILGGMITNAGGPQMVVHSATFDGVTLTTDVIVSNNLSVSLTLLDDLTNNATVTLANQGGGSDIFISGSQTLAGTGQVVFAGVNTANDGIFVNSGTFTVGPGMTIRAGGGLFLGNFFGPTLNLGTITSEASNSTATVYYFDNRNQLIGSGGGNLNLFSFTNSGTISVAGGGSLTVNAFNNTGTIRINGGNLELDGDWINGGVISADVAAVSMGGTFTTASALGIIHTGGSTITISGLMINTNTTLTLTPATGSWLINGGTIQGGTIAASGGAQLLLQPGPAITLDGVTLNTDLEVQGEVVNVYHGLTLNATLVATNASSQVYFFNNMTLGGSGQVLFGNYFYSAAGSLTIGPGQTIHCRGGIFYVDSPNPLINQGTFTVETNLNTTLYTSLGNFLNQGQVNVLDGGTLTVYYMTNSGTAMIGDSSVLTFYGDYVQAAGSTVLNGGNLAAQAGGSVLILGGNLSGGGAILAPVTNASSIILGPASGALAFSNNLVMTSSSTLNIQIGGTAQATQFGYATVAGDVSLDGSLGVTFINGFVPAAGSSFTVLFSDGSVGGTFTNIPAGNRITTLDGAGSFLYVQNGNSIILDDFEPSITPYLAWAQGYFGCTNCPQAAELADPDGDGVDNHDEFLSGTDPTSAASALRIISIARRTNDIVVTWHAVGGRTNVLQAATSDLSGSYTTNNFVDILPQIIVSGVGESNTNQIDVGGATNRPARYYRVRVVP